MYGDQFGEFACGYWGLKGYYMYHWPCQVLLDWALYLANIE